MVLAWLLAWGVAELAIAGGASPWVGWGPVVPFALVITWYGSRTALRAHGTLVVDRDGFSVARGRGMPEHHAWADVESFHLVRFGETPLAPGHPAPHFRLRGETADRDLPQTLGYSSERLTQIMTTLLELHRAGWPRTPRTWGEVLQDTTHDLEIRQER